MVEDKSVVCSECGGTGVISEIREVDGRQIQYGRPCICRVKKAVYTYLEPFTDFISGFKKKSS